MIGHRAIVDGLKAKMTLQSFFLLDVDQDLYESMSKKNSAHMVKDAFGTEVSKGVYKPAYWTPEVLLSPKDYPSNCDFGFVKDLIVQANFENYERGFKFLIEIANHQPAQIIALMGVDQPILMWNELQGFYE